MKNNRNKFTIIMIAIISMLTIYYFTNNDNKVPTNNQNQNEDNNVSRYITDEFTVRRETIDEARQQTMSDLQSMLASSSTAADQKTALIQAISDLNFIMAKETSLEILILNSGYDDAYVECNDYMVTIYVVSDISNLSDGEDIVSVNALIKLTNNHFGPGYNAEVVVIAPETN